MDAGADRSTGDRGEWDGHREILVNGADFDPADDGGQREGGFEHGEVVADALTRPPTSFRGNLATT